MFACAIYFLLSCKQTTGPLISVVVNRQFEEERERMPKYIPLVYLPSPLCIPDQQRQCSCLVEDVSLVCSIRLTD